MIYIYDAVIIKVTKENLHSQEVLSESKLPGSSSTSLLGEVFQAHCTLRALPPALQTREMKSHQRGLMKWKHISIFFVFRRFSPH